MNLAGVERVSSGAGFSSRPRHGVAILHKIPLPMTTLSTMFERLRSAGVVPGDSDDLKLKKQLLLFAMGLMTAAPMVWNALYGYFGVSMPTWC